MPKQYIFAALLALTLMWCPPLWAEGGTYPLALDHTKFMAALSGSLGAKIYTAEKCLSMPSGTNTPAKLLIDARGRP